MFKYILLNMDHLGIQNFIFELLTFKSHDLATLS